MASSTLTLPVDVLSSLPNIERRSSFATARASSGIERPPSPTPRLHYRHDQEAIELDTIIDGRDSKSISTAGVPEVPAWTMTVKKEWAAIVMVVPKEWMERRDHRSVVAHYTSSLQYWLYRRFNAVRVELRWLSVGCCDQHSSDRSSGLWESDPIGWCVTDIGVCDACTGPSIPCYVYFLRYQWLRYWFSKCTIQWIWQAKDILLKNIIDHATAAIKPFNEDKQNPPDPAFVLELEDEVRSGSNLYAVQKTFDGPFSFDVYYQSGSAGTKLDEATITAGIDAFKAKFAERFDLTIPVPEKYKAFAKDITSNLMGGIGYFYGTSLVDRSGNLDDEDDDETFMSEAERKERGRPELAPPTQLLTATPSRSFFPRGFYWDEGFHLQHIGTWDNDLSLEILKSWVELIDQDGWVGREQILGEEARSKVPAEFQTQYPNYANPPTLTMALMAFISRLEENAEPSLADLGMDQLPVDSTSTASEQSSKLLSPPAARAYLNEIYPALRRHYHWFRRTQRGQIRQWGRKATARGEAYRWRGRSAEHVLTSGLDDYPRPVPPHVGELHVDLMSWMGYFSNMMRRIADFIGESEDAAEYETIEKGIKANLDDLHWSKEEKMYCDVTVNEEDDSEHVCHAGYVSLFPLLLGLLEPSSPHLGPILDLIHDPERLWSPYGVRSLAANHPLFGQGENYWRGPVWIQINIKLGSSRRKVLGYIVIYQKL
ncbi:hypothetical protein RSAG8_00271, partial [Rhizoctonia solani AG-8 WAC10335]